MKTLVKLVLCLGMYYLSGCYPHYYDEPAFSGRVLAATSKQAIVGATVIRSADPRASATTTTDGSFLLPAVKRWEIRAIGLYDDSHTWLRVRRPGFHTKDVVVPRGSDHLDHPILLAEGLYNRREAPWYEY